MTVHTPFAAHLLGRTPNMLTNKERQTLNDAMAIIERITPQGASMLIGAGRYLDLPFNADVTYFDSRPRTDGGRQHGSIAGATFADKIQAVIDIEAALPSEEEQRAARIEALRAELTQLGEAA